MDILGNKMFIFGGDRHLMAFNDFYYFDLEKGVKSITIYHDKWVIFMNQNKKYAVIVSFNVMMS